MRGRIGLSVHVGGKQPNDQLNPKNKMNASILTSDRYIAIKSATGLTFNKTLRILTRDTNGAEVIVPCRWNDTSKRLESVALNDGLKVPNMYESSLRLISKLKAAGHLFQLINEVEAKALTT